MDNAAGSADQPGGAEGPELPGHGEAKVVVVVQIGLFLLPLDTLALLHELKVLDETHLALTNREAEALELGEGGAYAPSTQAEAVIEGYDS